MASAADERAAAKRAQISAAARAVFLERGYAGASMDAVTAAAGVSKQTLYRYFPSKAHLLTQVLEAELGVMEIGLDPTVPIPVTSVAQLRSMLLLTAHEVTRRFMSEDVIGLIRLVLGEVSRMPDVRTEFREVLPRRLLGLVGALLASADAHGVIRTPRPELSARLFVGPVVSFVILDGVLVEGPPQPPDADTLAFVVDAFIASLGPAGSAS